MTEEIFKVGDVVQLKSGEHRMTVKFVHRALTGEELVDLTQKVAKEQDETATLNDEELEDYESEPLPEGSIVTGYTCVWIDAAGEEHEKCFEPELLVRCN